MRIVQVVMLALTAVLALACSASDGDGTLGVDVGSRPDVIVAVDTPVAAPDLAAEVAAGEPLYDPYMVLPTSELPGVRGMVVKRGQIHAHTAYSHDGCDEKIDEEGILDQECLTQFRYGACWTDMDFVFITDHDDFMADYEFPEILLFREDEGDELILRNGAPVANWVDCGDGTRSLFSAGVDTKLLAIGLERMCARTSPSAIRSTPPAPPRPSPSCTRPGRWWSRPTRTSGTRTSCTRCPWTATRSTTR